MLRTVTLLCLLCEVLQVQARLQVPFGVERPAAYQQPGSTSPIDQPYRPLPWGQVNILHTTDTHGWLLGHQRQEASYSGDWGDLYSFVARMKEQAKERGVDLLVVDSGDRVDGNGLVDGEPQGHPKGYTALNVFKEMPYDILTTGNHELYRYQTALMTYNQLTKHYGSRYLTSNVNITLPPSDSAGLEGQTRPAGERYRKFRTEMGRNVTAFGFLFDFKAHDRGIDVQKPSEMVKEAWFREAITEAPDFFLLVGHMSIRKEEDSEWTIIFNAIREVHATVPILIFGGHHHIRDCAQEDERSMSLASGRYMETIGFMSLSGLDGPTDSPLYFSRRYLDQNRNTYKYHAGEDFDTEKGIRISQEMTKVAKTFNLTHKYGMAPQPYYLSRYTSTSEKSIFHLMVNKVLPMLIRRPDRKNPSIKVLNTGSVRFDVFKGAFTRNDQWIMLPFPNNFEYIPSVRRHIALQLLDYLNLVGEHHLDLPSSKLSPEQDASRIESLYQSNLHQSHILELSSLSTMSEQERRKREELTWGYVTYDACPGKGDDTLHKALPHAWQPTFVSTAFPKEEEGDFVDVVFFDFIRPDILGALNTLQKEKLFSEKDVGLYITNLSANTLMQGYATREWN